jgi:hypothetical protein
MLVKVETKKAKAEKVEAAEEVEVEVVEEQQQDPLLHYSLLHKLTTCKQWENSPTLSMAIKSK